MQEKNLPAQAGASLELELMKVMQNPPEWNSEFDSQRYAQLLGEGRKAEAEALIQAEGGPSLNQMQQEPMEFLRHAVTGVASLSEQNEDKKDVEVVKLEETEHSKAESVETATKASSFSMEVPFREHATLGIEVDISGADRRTRQAAIVG
eukprot:g22577.t1